MSNLPNKLPILYGDGIYDDTAAFRAMANHEPYQLPNGKILNWPYVDDSLSENESHK
jgi:hypothetical protein